ncbi:MULTISPECIES: hypothetical protein [unclassified Streptomyces]|uniref:hypothetical protein n=1 Tax=unclassified Streptomyces TaxID=2593676 RepID=UPI0038303759
MAQIDLDKVLDKAWADKELPAVMAAPVSALKGVSDRQGDLLQEAFGIKTVEDLANLKFARWAQALATLDATSK